MWPQEQNSFALKLKPNVSAGDEKISIPDPSVSVCECVWETQRERERVEKVRNVMMHFTRARVEGCTYIIWSRVTSEELKKDHVVLESKLLEHGH